LKSHTRMGKEMFDKAMQKRPPEERKFMQTTRLVWQTRRLRNHTISSQGRREISKVRSDVLERIFVLFVEYPDKTDEELAELLLAEEIEKDC